MITRVGFTGTRRGMTLAQSTALKAVLHSLDNEDTFHHDTLHHGDCVGADSQAHDIARECCMLVEIHPPLNGSWRAFRRGKHVSRYHKPLPYLGRNFAIVDATSLLIAAPHGPEERRSGTWSTVRYARKQRKPIIVVWPDGSETREGEKTT